MIKVPHAWGALYQERRNRGSGLLFPFVPVAEDGILCNAIVVKGKNKDGLNTWVAKDISYNLRNKQLL